MTNRSAVGSRRRRGDARVPATPLVPRIYDATTTHRRSAAAPAGLDRRFAYRTCYWLVDVDALPVLPRPLRWLVRFEGRDHVGGAAGIADGSRALLAKHGLSADRILLLTCPRTLGHVFNPLSVHYCLRSDAAGERLVAVIAEVHNTYGGRHAYVLQPDESGADDVDKGFYVSPFLPMGGTYTMRTPPPDDRLSVVVSLRQGGATAFVATLSGPGQELTVGTAWRALLRWPLLTLRTTALIRWQGVRLWLRRVPLQPQAR